MSVDFGEEWELDLVSTGSSSLILTQLSYSTEYFGSSKIPEIVRSRLADWENSSFLCPSIRNSVAAYVQPYRTIFSLLDQHDNPVKSKSYLSTDIYASLWSPLLNKEKQRHIDIFWYLLSAIAAAKADL